jgi:hypothetical protein
VSIRLCIWLYKTLLCIIDNIVHIVKFKIESRIEDLLKIASCIDHHDDGDDTFVLFSSREY